MASMDSGVLRKTERGHDEAVGHPVHALFSGRPHPNYTKYDFIQGLVANACLGNGYARIHWDDYTGRPGSVELLPSNAVAIDYLPSGEMVYRVAYMSGNTSVLVTLPTSDVIHIKGFITVDAITGRRVSLIHKEVFGSALSAIDFPSEFFKNGVHSPGFLTRPEIIGDSEYTAIQRRVQSARGVSNAGGMPFFDGGMSFERIGQTMADACLTDFAKLTAEQVSQITGVPLHMLAENSHSTFTNMEQQSADYISHCVNPWAVKLEQELSTKLFSPSEVRRGSHFFNFDVESSIRGDTEAIAKLITSVIPNSVMTPNEVRRRFFKLNKMEGGDELLAQVNMIQLNRLGEVKEDTETDKVTDTQTDNEGDKQPAASK